MKKIPAVTLTGLLALSCLGAVEMKETSLALPSYPPGPYDKNPIFYTGRIYQGAQGRAYPYPMQDVMHDERVEKPYKALHLENEYLSMNVLPEIGGRLLSLTDKASGFEVFYRQHVIKPALIGMLGAWTSGGVEWNFPHHHRATTFMPVDYRLVDNGDGSKAVWIGETELRQRMKWSIGLSMVPGKNVLQADCRFINPQPYIQSMLYWANVSVHCGTNYQVIFPPSCRIGFDHHKVFFTPYPRGLTDKNDPASVADLSWWKNFTASDRSIFALDPDNNFLAGYDYGKECGTVHVANRHIVCGKKFFLWGNNEEGFVWDKVLTEHDGPYLELMVGAYSDNQPDYSWIGPYEMRALKQFWYPIKGIHGVKAANLDAAVNLERRAPGKVFLGFNSTAPAKSAKVELLAKGKELFSEVIDIDPNKPYTKEIAVEPTLKDQQLTGRLVAADGRELVSYTPVPDIQPPVPEPVEPFKAPKDVRTVEELYLAGMRLEQFHNGALDPVPYYEEALRRDPDDARVNLALGIRRAREGRLDEAAGLLRRSIARTTWNYTRARDAEANYMLGVVLAELGKDKEAEDELWKAVWRDGFQRPGYLELAKLACRRGDDAAALERVDDALAVAQRSAFAHTLRAYVLRRLGRRDEAGQELKQALACDPLDVWSLAEGRFLAGEATGALAAAAANRGNPLQQTLEIVCDYINIGGYAEALALLDAAEAAGPAFASPMVDYARGYLFAKQGRRDAAKQAFRAAAARPTDYCFPFRHEELKMLELAVALTPEEANTWYYLGDICYYYEMKARGILAWEKALALQPGHGLALRNLGFAYGQIPAQLRKGLDYYNRAIEADPENAVALIGRDKLAEKLGEKAADRLAYLQAHQKLVGQSDQLTLRLVYLYNAVGNYEDALQVLTTRRFHVWEGAEALRQPFVDAALMLGIRRLEAGEAEAALRYFKLADTYPENLQAGRSGNPGQSSKIDYYAALACRKLGRQTEAERYFRQVLGKHGGSGSGWLQTLQTSVADGEMSYYRLLALNQLGEKEGQEGQREIMRAVIAGLKKPVQIDAYAKFGGENTPLERVSSRKALRVYIEGLLALSENRPADAADAFKEVLALEPDNLWARYWLARETTKN